MYLYAKKQISLQEPVQRPGGRWMDYTIVQLLKIDTYIEISNYRIENDGPFGGNCIKFEIVSNKGETKTIFLYQYDLDKCIFFETLEEVKAHQEKELAKDKSKYIIKYKGENYKDKKYKRVQDIFCSLMSEFGYYSLFWNSLTKENIAKNPELRSINDFPYWCDTSCGQRNLNDLKDFEIHKYFGAKKPTEKIEYDLYHKISKNFNTLHLALEYGLCVKDLYSKIESADNSEEFKYILVYTPSDYKDDYKWETMKEDISIKANLKGIPNTSYIKSTKYGKTAIAFNDMEMLVTFFLKFDEEHRNNINMFTLDEGKKIECNGDATLYILDKALDNILAI